MIRFNRKNYCWGISSINQKVINFKNNFKKEPLVLEIGSGKGELLDKIIQIYGLKNFYSMQPKNNEYSEHNDFLKKKLESNFLEYKLEDYVKLNNFNKYDIIYIFKWNISFHETEEFLKSLKKILNKEGIIYITSVEKERFHCYPEEFGIKIDNLVNKYFDMDRSIQRVGNEIYGDVILKNK